MADPSLFTWPYDIELAKGLEEGGHEVRIYGRNPAKPLLADEASFLRTHFYPGIDTKWLRRLPPKGFHFVKGLSHAESMVRLLVTLRRWRPDVIHFQWTPLPIVDQCFVALFCQIAPTLLTVHDTAPFNNNPGSSLQRIGAIDIMRRFDHLIVHTASGQRRLESYGLSRDRISQISHGLLSGGDGRGVASSPSPGSGPVILLMFGQIKPYKGVDVLFRAVAKMPSAARGLCRIRVVGRPQMEMQPLFDLAIELGIHEQVEFDLRYVPDDEAKQIIAAADILLFPYREIDASGVLMLSLDVARPIVASRIGLFAEMLEDGRHGSLVPPSDPDALAQALLPLVSSPELRDTISCAVAELARSIPGWSKIAEKTAALYDALRNLP